MTFPRSLSRCGPASSLASSSRLIFVVAVCGRSARRHCTGLRHRRQPAAAARQAARSRGLSSLVHTTGTGDAVRAGDDDHLGERRPAARTARPPRPGCCRSRGSGRPRGPAGACSPSACGSPRHPSATSRRELPVVALLLAQVGHDPAVAAHLDVAGVRAEGGLPLRLTTRTSVMPGNGSRRSGRRPPGSAAGEGAQRPPGPPRSARRSGRTAATLRREARSRRCTVRGWIASKVLLKSLTLASGPRGSSASSSQLMYEFGWASRMPGRSRANSSATCAGSASRARPSGSRAAGRSPAR